jgi:apolipoprotein N-acyltransferase
MPCNYDIDGAVDNLNYKWSDSVATSAFYFSLSAICDGFGNSLEPISVLVLLSNALLISGFEHLFVQSNSGIKWDMMLKYFGGLVFLQGLSFLLGFNSLSAYPSVTAVTVVESFGGGMVISIFNVILVYVPYVYYSRKYKNEVLKRALAYSCMCTMVTCCLVGNIFSTFPAAGNAVLDIGPLAQVASIFGIGGVQFLTTCVPCYSALLVLGEIAPDQRDSKKAGPRGSLLVDSEHGGAISTAVRTNPGLSALMGLVLLLTTAGFLTQSGLLYQIPVSDLIPKTVPVSCIFSHTAAVNDSALWAVAEARVAAGDAIVLMSEEAFGVHSDEEERELLDRALTTVAASPLADAYLGVTYLKTPEGATMSTNQFALLSNNQPNYSAPLWNYHKTHPVPLIEDDVTPGSGVLPLYTSPTLGRLSGSICFDMDFPLTIQQAGQNQVDVMLQPSWTWGAILSRHFDGDAVRAVENGFTLFRCSSDGESGIVGPRGRVLARSYTGHEPEAVALYSLPLNSHVNTIYNNGGLAFDWLCLAGSVVVYYWAFVAARPDYSGYTAMHSGGEYVPN